MIGLSNFTKIATSSASAKANYPSYRFFQRVPKSTYRYNKFTT